MSDVSQETCGTRPRRSGICKCGGTARPGQGDCHGCHAKAVGRYRERLAAKRAADQAAYIRLMADRAKHQDEGKSP